MESRKKRETYYCINITILNRQDNSPEKYIAVFSRLRSLNAVKVRGNDCIKVRTVSETNLEDEKFLTGKITKYTKLESAQWFDESRNEGTTVEVPDNVHPNMVETEYYFWPKKHKLYLKKNYESGSPTYNQVERYLNIIFDKSFDEEIKATIVQSKDSIERIINAREIYTLSFELTYSNSDTDTEASEFLDDLYKDSHASEIQTKLKSSENNKINGSSDYVIGNLLLARRSGNAEARIEDNDGSKTTIKTKDYPAKSQARETDWLFRTKLCLFFRSKLCPFP